MGTITASEARAKLYRLIDEAAESHEPIVITGKRANAVLVSEEDWSAMRETLFLLSVPGMRESIKAGMDAPVEECDQALDWRAGRWCSPSRCKRMPRSSPRQG